MQRELKFRAWTKNNYMAYQGEPDLGHIQSFFHHYGDEEYIMQFTGLKDKNGVEIYEGDYLGDRFPIDEEDLSLGYHESLLLVVWCNKQLMWCVDVSFAKDGSYLTSLVDYFGEFLEVKGNIYENSEC